MGGMGGLAGKGCGRLGKVVNGMNLPFFVVAGKGCGVGWENVSEVGNVVIITYFWRLGIRQVKVIC